MAELTGRHLLLLQGPAGPFFARVALQLRAAGARVTKVNFNGGEDLYYRGSEVVRFRESLAKWPAFFCALVEERAVDGVVLFGDCRPLHRLAIEQARERGLGVFVFEEGYLRPDYVTLERDGVNGHSAIPKHPEFFATLPLHAERPHRKLEHVFLKSALHTIVYACAAALSRRRYPEYEHHRDIRPLEQAGCWLRGGVRRALHTVRDRSFGERLDASKLPPFFFVPLQVHLDSQLRHSHFATINEFIREVVETFAEHAPADHALVLKLHPMDRPYRDYAADIEQLTANHQLHGRLFYVDVINLPAALRSARGTVVINSTVGLSSLTHGTPVKCLGRAVYDMPGLTHQGSLADFFRGPAPVDRARLMRFRQWLLQENQLNGSVWSRVYDDPARLMRQSDGPCGSPRSALRVGIMTPPQLLNDDGSASMATMFMMSHHGLRRDLACFERALKEPQPWDDGRVQAIRSEWQSFRGTLHGHHYMEDTAIFSSMRGEHPELLPLFDELDAQHRLVDALLERGDRAFTEVPERLAALAVVRELYAVLEPHLAKEEQHIVPLIRGAKAFPAPSTEAEADMYAQGFAWSSHGIAPDILDKVYGLLPPLLTSRLPAARSAFSARCERAWGSAAAGSARTPVPSAEEHSLTQQPVSPTAPRTSTR